MDGAAVHRAADRFLSRFPGGLTRHSFSFGPHYDPANTGFGPLVLHDEHRLDPGAGFAPHRHAGVEVVSWVLEGVLVHEGAGGRHELGPGMLQHLSTGSGVEHAERAGGEPTRFVQAWLLAEDPAAAPSYAVSAPGPDGLQPVLRVGAAVLHAGRLPSGGPAVLGGGLLHVFVASGSVAAAGTVLQAGDALRWSRPEPLALRARQECDLLVWEMRVSPLQE